MFIYNKYYKYYFNIINSATNNQKTGYTEKHHIIPKSLGGSDDAENLVTLTAREHFICHWLLTKMTTGVQKRSMCHAAWNMVNQKTKNQQRYKVSSRVYESIKKANSIALSEANTGKPSKNKGRIVTLEWREKLRQANLGKKRSAESCAKQALTMTGKKRTQEECNAISNGLKGRVSPTKGMKFSEETRKKMSEARKAVHAAKKNR
jgi:hypothetical protein